MSRRGSASASEAALRVRTPGKYLRRARVFSMWVLVACMLCGVVWGMASVEQFVINDKTFVLDGPPEPGIKANAFQIEGVQHASEKQITDLFLRDFGRSIYLCPIAERRRRILGIDWVQEASVSRIWPNRIVVRIRERKPVAFVQLSSRGGSMSYELVDADGVLLDPRRTSRLALPVLAGIRASENEPGRKQRVARFLRLQAELGESMANISEIDVSDIENLKVVQASHGRAITLMLGNRDYLQRYQGFVRNYDEIYKRLPGATVLDLRLKDRITVAGSEPPVPAGVKEERRK